MCIKLFSISLLILSTFAFGQKSKTQLEKERIDLSQKIKSANAILKETQSQEKASLGELSALQNLIEVNEALAKNLNQEIILAKQGIKTVQTEIKTLEAQINQLAEDYARMLYKAQKTINDRKHIIFIFSSDNYNQLSIRIKYLEMVREARRKQLTKIQKIKVERGKIQNKLAVKNKEKEYALNRSLNEKKRLDSLKVNQGYVVTQLQSQQGELFNDIGAFKKEQEKIDKLINDIIKAEIARKKRLAKERIAAERKKTSVNSQNFAANKGKLNWPIQKGFISRKFGMQNHPTIPGIKVNNPGIGLQTSKGAKVKAVFKGEVMTVADIPGAGKLVMVEHGSYFTVYSKLFSTTVKKGDQIKFGQVIGVVNTDPNGVTELGFQIWRNTEKENPEQWLAKN